MQYVSYHMMALHFIFLQFENRRPACTYVVFFGSPPRVVQLVKHFMQVSLSEINGLLLI